MTGTNSISPRQVRGLIIICLAIARYFEAVLVSMLTT
jgi:hypothetical protein